MKYLLIPALLLLGACSNLGNTPTLVYAKGKCTITGMGSAGILVAGANNGFTITSDCGDGAYLFIGPPGPNFNPPAAVFNKP